jgi:hypothetical protein
VRQVFAAGLELDARHWQGSPALQSESPKHPSYEHLLYAKGPLLPQRPFGPLVQSESSEHSLHAPPSGGTHVEASGEIAARCRGHAEPAGL